MLKDLCDHYIENLKHYNELENQIIPSRFTDEQLLYVLHELTGEKRAIQREQDFIINTMLKPYEKCEMELDEESARIFSDFTARLTQKNRNIDNAISLRVHKMLLRYAKKKCDYNMIVQELYGCGISEWYVYLSCPNRSMCTHFGEVIQYKEYYGKLSSEGKKYYIRCLCNQILAYTNQRAGKLLETGEIIFRELDEIEQKYGSLPMDADSVRMTVIKNCMTCTLSFRNGIDYTVENTKKAFYYAQKAREIAAKKGKEALESFDSIDSYQFIRFHAGEIDITELLSILDKQIQPREDFSRRENCRRVYKLTASYIEYIRLYSTLSLEEIEKFVKKKVMYALEYTEQLKRDEESAFVNEYLSDFIGVSFDLYPIDKAVGMLIKVTVNQHKPTCIHTLVVEHICRVLIKAALKTCPEKLAGVMGYSAQEVTHHKREICNIMRQSALLHDIGKYKFFDVISNSSRRLEDVEFQCIKYHPEYGYRYLKNLNIPEAIKDCVLLHHRWHNGRGGYPDERPTQNQPLVDILSIADSLDAATDNFGRSYAMPKSIDELIDEFEFFRDTRYGGFVIDLLKQPEQKAMVGKILSRERNKIICRIWSRRN